MYNGKMFIVFLIAVAMVLVAASLVILATDFLPISILAKGMIKFMSGLFSTITIMYWLADGPAEFIHRKLGLVKPGVKQLLLYLFRVWHSLSWRFA